MSLSSSSSTFSLFPSPLIAVRDAGLDSMQRVSDEEA